MSPFRTGGVLACLMSCGNLVNKSGNACNSNPPEISSVERNAQWELPMGQQHEGSQRRACTKAKASLSCTEMSAISDVSSTGSGCQAGSFELLCAQ